MRILVYGGRDFGLPNKDQHIAGLQFLNKLSHDWPKLEPDEYGNWLPNVTVISGMARGADTIGVDWATINWTPLERYPADWATHGKAAGFIRNQQMLDSGIDLAVQFPGGNGTRDMRSRLDKAGVRVVEYVGEE